MAQTEDQTGTEKKVIEKEKKVDADFGNQRKTKFKKKATGKKQHAAIKNIIDLDAEKMASSLPSDDTVPMTWGKAPMIKEISEESPESVLEQSSEPVSEKSPESVLEQSSEPVSEKSPESVLEQSSEPVSEKSPESVLEQSSEPVSEKSPESVLEPSSEPVPEKSPESVLEPSSEPVPEKSPEFVLEQSSEPVHEKSLESVLEPSSEPMPEKLTQVQKKEEICKDEKELVTGSKIKGKRGKLPGGKNEKALLNEKRNNDDIEGIMRRFEGDKTRDIICLL